MARKKKPAEAPEAVRGVQSLDRARAWLAARKIEDIECVVPDQAGVGRGKMMPVEKFLDGPTMTLPSSVLTQTITGDYPDDDESFQHDPADLRRGRFKADMAEIRHGAPVLMKGRNMGSWPTAIFKSPPEETCPPIPTFSTT